LAQRKPDEHFRPGGCISDYWRCCRRLPQRYLFGHFRQAEKVAVPPSLAGEPAGFILTGIYYVHCLIVCAHGQAVFGTTTNPCGNVVLALAWAHLPGRVSAATATTGKSRPATWNVDPGQVFRNSCQPGRTALADAGARRYAPVFRHQAAKSQEKSGYTQITLSLE